MPDARQLAGPSPVTDDSAPGRAAQRPSSAAARPRAFVASSLDAYAAIDVEFTRDGSAVTEVALVGRGWRRTWVLARPDDPAVLREVMAELPGRILVGYNVSADVAALRRWCARARHRWRPVRSICLMREARTRWRGRRWRLEDALRTSGVPFDRSRLHGAEYDAEMAWSLWERMGSRPRVAARRRG